MIRLRYRNARRSLTDRHRTVNEKAVTDHINSDFSFRERQLCRSKAVPLAFDGVLVEMRVKSSGESCLRSACKALDSNRKGS